MKNKGIFSAVALAVVVSLTMFQNCGSTFKVANNVLASNAVQGGTDYCHDHPVDPTCSGSTSLTVRFNGQEIPEGQNVVAYQNSTVPAGSLCVSEIRVNHGGVLSGSFVYSTCAVNQPAACLFNGITVASGTSVVAYQNSSVGAGDVCVSQSRTCTKGLLLGSFNFAACQPTANAACLFNGMTIPHGQSVAGFALPKVDFGQICTSQVRVCRNGALSGAGDFAACVVNQAAPCLFNGRTLADGESVTAYDVSSVAATQTCAPRSRTCQNGQLSGQGQFASCSVDAPRSCLINGQTIANGESISLYVSSEADANGLCRTQVRTCTDASLSGSANAGTCLPAAGPSFVFQTGALRLTTGQSLDAGDLNLRLQTDGNLVLSSKGQAIWSTGTNGRCVRCAAEMRVDGNFVVTDLSTNQILFETATRGEVGTQIKFGTQKPLAYVMDPAGNILWTSSPEFHELRLGLGKTIQMQSGTSRLNFTLQSDKNLVLLRDDRPVWSSDTVNACGGNCVAVFQDDGNLVMIDQQGLPIFDTRTTGSLITFSANPPYLSFERSEVANEAPFASADEATEALWNGNAHFETRSLMNMPTLANLSSFAFASAMNSGTQIAPLDGKWYLFNREYYFAPRPANCPADYARIVVRSSNDAGKTWGAPVVVAEPKVETGECALVDGHAFFDAETNRWHYISQAWQNNRWNMVHYWRDGRDPLGAFVADSHNPVVRGGDLWSRLCAGPSSVCPGSTTDEGTPEISFKKDGYFYVTFHGAYYAATVYGYRGIARTRDFVTWETTGGDLPGLAIYSGQDCQIWSVAWDTGGCIGGGHGSSLITDRMTYLVIEATDHSLLCEVGQHWVAGILRAPGFTATGQWEAWSGNPLLAKDDSSNVGCAIQYQRIFFDQGSLYLTYWIMEPIERQTYFHIAQLKRSTGTMRVLDAKQNFLHQSGQAEGDGWSVAASGTSSYPLYGPYLTDLPPQRWTARFYYMVDNNSDPANSLMLTFDVFDATAGTVLSSRGVLRHDLPTPGTWSSIDLGFNWSARVGHKLEMRVRTEGYTYVKVNRVELLP